MIIIGLHNGHDSSITLMKDGLILGHWELERIFGQKHFMGWFNKNCVAETMDKILPQFGLSSDDIDCLCFSSIEFNNNGWINTEFKSLINDAKKNDNNGRYVSWISMWRDRQIQCFASLHHINHMAYGYFTSPFDDAFVFAYDGKGDFNMNTCYGEGHGNKLIYIDDIRNNNKLRNNHLGYCYSQLYRVFGFFGNVGWATAGKVMGLSSYGEPDDKWRNAIRDYIENPMVQKLSDAIQLSNDPHSKEVQNFIATFQNEAEQYVETTISELLKSHPHKNLVISGGCGLNVSINTKLQSLCDRIYIPPACSDTGQTLGAVMYYWHSFLNNEFKGIEWHNPYLGDEVYNKEYVFKCKKDFPNICFKVIDSEEELLTMISKLLLNDKIIAWAQGRSEIGPRALGNRSILCSPISPKMKDKINLNVKHREWWRPFAPVCKYESYEEWFELNHEQPYMLEAPLVKSKKRNLIPAVTHVDGTARVQTLKFTQNPLLHNLLTCFEKCSGIPILLNTSLNGKGLPIANDAKDIITLLDTTKLDYAVIGNIFLFKNKSFL